MFDSLPQVTKVSHLNRGTFQDEEMQRSSAEKPKALVIKRGIKSPFLHTGNQKRLDAGPDDASTVKY